ncbi:hypothetical protein ABZ871_38170 [Streptomyces populi]
MSHRGQRAPKPQNYDRNDRRAALDIYLDRMERDITLSPQESALVAAQVREEMRIAAATRKSLRETTEALMRLRGATDSAVQEAEGRAQEAEDRLATMTAQRLAVEPAAGADEMRRQAVANALQVAAGTPWPSLIEFVGTAHQWALKARELGEEVTDLRDRLTRAMNARNELRRSMSVTGEDRCGPAVAPEGHPVFPLIAALTSDRAITQEAAVGLTSAYYYAVHAECCQREHPALRTEQTSDLGVVVEVRPPDHTRQALDDIARRSRMFRPVGIASAVG